MAYWLTYTRCDDCPNESCLQCKRPDRKLTLHVVEAEDRPECSLNGPCASSSEVLGRMFEYFGVDAESGIIYFRVKPNE
jgi:hypothetical protein